MIGDEKTGTAERTGAKLEIDTELASKFQGLSANINSLKNVKIQKENVELEHLKNKVVEDIRKKWVLNQLREHRIFRAYRDFFWRVGVDPTKIRPAAEALIRRVLRGRSIPRINSLVDSYNLASMVTNIPLAAFDSDRLSGSLVMREAKAGEEFLGIGMEKPMVLKGGEAVVQDNEKLVAIYPYRDAEACKINLSTKNVLIMVCGVPKIEEFVLANAGKITVDYVKRFCNGSEE